MKRIAIAVAHFFHRYFLGFLLITYVFAYFFPSFGATIRTTSVGTFHGVDGSEIKVTISILLLALLLFNAGLGLKIRELKRLRHSAAMLVFGYMTNLILPFFLVLILGGLVTMWSETPERKGLIFGLSLLAALPIAGASAAWSEDAEGNMGLSLGLVLLSTLLSPITTPLILIGLSRILFPGHEPTLFTTALEGIGVFLILAVVIPSVVGIFANWLGRGRIYPKLKPYIKFTNFVNLLLLNYSNASVALPKLFTHLPWAFIALVCTLAGVLCILRFLSGWALGRITRAPQDERLSLLFGLGMNNNGSGLIFAAELFGGYLAVVLPVIVYTIVQQITAALIDRRVSRWETI